MNSKVSPSSDHVIRNYFFIVKKFGMQTLNSALLELVQSNTVTPQDAWMKAIDRQNLKDTFDRNGVDTSSLVG